MELVDVVLQSLLIYSLSNLILYVFRILNDTSPFKPSPMHESLVDRSLTPLSESFCAPFNSTSEGFLARMSAIVLNQILLQSKLFAALVANPIFLYFVDLHVAL